MGRVGLKKYRPQSIVGHGPLYQKSLVLDLLGSHNICFRTFFPTVRITVHLDIYICASSPEEDCSLHQEWDFLFHFLLDKIFGCIFPVTNESLLIWIQNFCRILFLTGFFVVLLMCTLKNDKWWWWWWCEYQLRWHCAHKIGHLVPNLHQVLKLNQNNNNFMAYLTIHLTKIYLLQWNCLSPFALCVFGC